MGIAHSIKVSYVRCVTRAFITGFIICLKMTDKVLEKDTQPMSQNIDEDIENVAPTTESTSWGLLLWTRNRDLNTERLRFVFFCISCEFHFKLHYSSGMARNYTQLVVVWYVIFISNQTSLKSKLIISVGYSVVSRESGT